MTPLHANGRTTGERWLPGGVGSASGVRLFCFPYAGGAASAFNSWRNAFPPHINVCPVQYPGRETRWGEPGFDNVGALVQAITYDLSTEWRGDFALWGHSFGGLVAFELTRRLWSEEKVLPIHLFLSAIRAPDCPSDDPIHNLPEQEFVARLRQFGGISEEIIKDPDLRNTFIPIVKHDFRLYEEYRFESGEPLPVPLSIFGGLQDEHAAVGDLLAWSYQTSRTFRSRFFEGDHFFHLRYVSQIAGHIDGDLKASWKPAANLTAR